MDDRSNGLLHQRLDRLEEKGRTALLQAVRAAAWADAATLAGRSSIVVPVLLLIMASMRPVAVLPAILFSVVVPLVVLLAAVAIRMARVRIGRGAALAAIDRSLALKDRAVIAAEFLADDRQDGFRRAALQEAMPWLDQATAAPLDRGGHAVRPAAYRWVMPFLALVALVAALTIRPGVPARPVDGKPSAMRRIAMAIGLRPDAGDAEADRQDLRATGGDRGASDMAGRGAAGGSAVGVSGAAAMAKSGGDGASPATPLGQSQNGGSGASPSSGAGRGDGRGTGGAMTDTAGDRQPGGGAEARQGADAKQADEAQASAPESRATPPQGGQSGAAAGVSAPTGAPPAPRNPGSGQDRQRSGSRDRQPSGEQSQGSGSSGRANNNGQQGSNRGDGQEGAKRSRGSSSLMLAVPMEDRVIGTVNAGAVSSTARNAPPRAVAAGIVAAQSRGAGRGAGAAVPERLRSVQEDRLLERYFARKGVGQ